MLALGVSPMFTCTRLSAGKADMERDGGLSASFSFSKTTRLVAYEDWMLQTLSIQKENVNAP